MGVGLPAFRLHLSGRCSRGDPRAGEAAGERSRQYPDPECAAVLPAHVVNIQRVNCRAGLSAGFAVWTCDHYHVAVGIADPYLTVTGGRGDMRLLDYLSMQ